MPFADHRFPKQRQVQEGNTCMKGTVKVKPANSCALSIQRIGRVKVRLFQKFKPHLFLLILFTTNFVTDLE